MSGVVIGNAAYPLPRRPCTMFGKLIHLGVDALLVSAFLAGVRRSTGLTYVPANAACRALNVARHRQACSRYHPEQGHSSSVRILCMHGVVLTFSIQSGFATTWRSVRGYVVSVRLVSLLLIGEYAYDFAVVFLGVRSHDFVGGPTNPYISQRSSYFERKR